MKEIKKIYGQFGFMTLLIVLSGLAVHLGMFAAGQTTPGIVDDHTFFRSMLSASFVSETAFEVFFSVMILIIWTTMRHTMGRIHRVEIEKEKQKATIRAYQEVMGIMAESIGQENNRILRKIAFRKSRGQNVSPTIESASQNIAMILATLSRIGFSDAYLDAGPGELSRTLLQEVKLVTKSS